MRRLSYGLLLLAVAGALPFFANGQSPSSGVSVKSTEIPKYAGKTFEQWLKEFPTLKDPSKRETAIRALCSFPPSTSVKAIPAFLVELRKHPTTPVDLSVRCNLCYALSELFSTGEKVDAKLKAEAVVLLRYQLRDTQAILRYRAATALGTLGRDATSAIPDLMVALRDGATWEVRQAAAAALGAISGDGSNGPPTAVLKGLYDVLHDQAFQVRMAAVQSLAILGPGPNQDLSDNYVSALMPVALKDPEPGLQIWARIAIIGATKDFGASNIAPIAKHVSHIDPGVRSQAIQALGALGPQAKSSVTTLVAALKDEDQSVQISAMWALGRMETSGASALPILEKIASDINQSDYMKKSAKDSIEKIKGK